MNWIYVIQDKYTETCAATFEQRKAVQLCKELGPETTYRSVPFHSCTGTEITVKSGPIPKAYLPEKS